MIEEVMEDWGRPAPPCLPGKKTTTTVREETSEVGGSEDPVAMPSDETMDHLLFDLVAERVVVLDRLDRAVPVDHEDRGLTGVELVGDHQVMTVPIQGCLGLRDQEFRIGF